MPLLLPRTRGVRREANFTGRPLTTWGTVLTSDSVAHQFPATFTQLIASTAFDTDWVNIWFHTNFVSNTDTDSLVTIYVGAGGAEVALIPLLLAGWVGNLGATDYRTRRYGFPLRIPAGSRLSAQHRSVRVSTGVTCMIELLGETEDHWVGTGVEQVGADTATSSGTYITPGTTAEGTLTSLGAATTREWGFVVPMLGGNTDTSLLVGVESLDIARGSTTADLISGLDDFIFTTHSTEFSGNEGTGRYCNIPAGITPHVRTRFSGTAEAKAYALYGVF